MPTVYCIDTSSLIAAWQERYPIENFPSFWAKVEALIDADRLVAPIEVLHETAKRSDELHAWLKMRNTAFRELSGKVQTAAAEVLVKFPRLVGERKLRTSADPFVIALARVEGLQIVTEERPTGSAARPNIPDVCPSFGMTPLSILEMIQAEKWVIG
jgi:Domain of unknown function (DUF4411)